MTEPMIELHSLDDVYLGDNVKPGRTPKAQELLECAFMLCCFAKEGAPITPPVLGWARGMLWRNGEVAP